MDRVEDEIAFALENAALAPRRCGNGLPRCSTCST